MSGTEGGSTVPSRSTRAFIYPEGGRLPHLATSAVEPCATVTP